MEVEFADDELDRLETDPQFSAGFGREIIRGFRKAMQAIRAAADERDLFYSKGCISRSSKERSHTNDLSESTSNGGSSWSSSGRHPTRK